MIVTKMTVSRRTVLRGIGTAVLRRLILSARNRKIQHLRMNCHGQNQAMQALARKFKADLRIDHAETVGDIIPRAATPSSALMGGAG